MGIDFGKIVLAESSKAQLQEIHIIGIGSPNPKAIASFAIQNEDGASIDAKQVTLEGAAFNAFYAAWEGATAARQVYALINPGVAAADLPAEIEQEFHAVVNQE